MDTGDFPAAAGAVQSEPLPDGLCRSADVGGARRRENVRSGRPTGLSTASHKDLQAVSGKAVMMAVFVHFWCNTAIMSVSCA